MGASGSGSARPWSSIALALNITSSPPAPESIMKRAACLGARGRCLNATETRGRLESMSSGSHWLPSESSHSSAASSSPAASDAAARTTRPDGPAAAPLSALLLLVLLLLLLLPLPPSSPGTAQRLSGTS